MVRDGFVCSLHHCFLWHILGHLFCVRTTVPCFQTVFFFFFEIWQVLMSSSAKLYAHFMLVLKFYKNNNFVCNFAKGKFPTLLMLVAKCHCLVQSWNLPCSNRTARVNNLFPWLWLNLIIHPEVLQNISTSIVFPLFLMFLVIRWRIPIFFKARSSLVSYNYFHLCICFYFQDLP